MFEDFSVHVDQELRKSATSLRQSVLSAQLPLVRPLIREYLLAQLCSHMQLLERESFESLVEIYKGYDMLLYQPITVMPKKKEDTQSYYNATVIGYSGDGYLIVEVQEGGQTQKKVLVNEEVSVRPAQK